MVDCRFRIVYIVIGKSLGQVNSLRRLRNDVVDDGMVVRLPNNTILCSICTKLY